MKGSPGLINSNQRRAIRRYSPIFLFPTLIAFVIGFVWPFFWGLYLSFFRFRTLSKTSFVGFENYIKVFNDSTFLSSFIFTVIFTVVSVLLINIISFIVAYFLTSSIKGTTIFRTIFFLPNLIGGIVLGYLWKIILDAVIMKYFQSCNLRFLGTCNTGVLATNRLYDDNLYSRTAKCTHRAY